MQYIHDTTNGVIHGIWYSRYHIIHSFIIIPVGFLVLLSILYGFNVLLRDIAQIKFPSSVLCMLINLFILVSLKTISNLQAAEAVSERTWKGKVGYSASWVLEHYLMIIRPPMNFSLKWINVFFIPSFVILPLSESISFIECLKIGAIFVVGGITLMMVDIYMILCLRKVFQFIRILPYCDSEKLPSEAYLKNKECEKETQSEVMKPIKISQSYILAPKDITTIDISSLRSIKTYPEYDNRQTSFLSGQNNECKNLQIFATSTAGIELSTVSEVSFEQESSQEKPHSKCDPPYFDTSITNEHSTTTKTVANFITSYIDWILYLALFLLSLPFYYISTIHVMLPFHLGLTVISYYIAIQILDKFPKAKRFAHPILILTAEVLFVCFISSLIYHSGSPKGFLDDLKYYKTGKNYLNLFNGKAMYNSGEFVPQGEGITSQPMWPGCGDFLSSLMDVSIVSLSLPMFTHRGDFVKNFWVLLPPLLSSVSLTFFCYPLICYKVGISSERSIGFIGRLVTLALGTPLIDSLGGSISLMAVCTILSGICGVLIGDPLFKVLRISANDYVTRGVTLGINCGAIATAHLLNLDPRAAAMSSLSFSLFGTIMIVLASISTIRDLIQRWVDL
ncbi:hypothetical protein METBIDRAFT_43101 [Metschnikowia bicuspidata var. bicuspidata NRRL YB-4993]|uniref:LrgB-domain-containing protein n=1 Tax=Metschnikowia bicuspidata var. bicuspidata NRRL YB-4993 TaxID=869754 RepID=A0A1A0H8U7_9ASCO|nr:hypothetical protein METBIDRAFT_43101 [Metschnikowia bicuspidata var. bicuspidata NRRL YB-4993]OBA20544.1 hypothetical protein METBIDRAFT_43101 [Metschnikowia bicuspidata var. bicuspidata NRRL YB-4993]